LKNFQVKALLIGGQACIVYGASEFSRDSDFVILSDNANLENLKKALVELKAEAIYVPELKEEFLKRGHGCHFRCNAEDVKDLRIDVMSRLRGCAPFEELWGRRNSVVVEGQAIDIISLQDLVTSKKTQRDKDWFMLKRLIEADIIKHENDITDERLRWWFLESRESGRLVRLAGKFPDIAKECSGKRKLLEFALAGDIHSLGGELLLEEKEERGKDIEYWKPLKKELETLRHAK